MQILTDNAKVDSQPGQSGGLGHSEKPATKRPMYSVAVAQKLGVLCKSCRTGIEIDDEYFPGTRAQKAVADLNGKKLVSWTEMKGVQLNMPDEEQGEVSEPVKENAEVQAALKRRGITDFETVACGGYPAAYFATAEEQGRRLFRIRMCAAVWRVRKLGADRRTYDFVGWQREKSGAIPCSPA